ncbi:MAG TPA: hypothetical protein VFZ66_30110 [Herpetosiphonaceae bacterium]
MIDSGVQTGPLWMFTLITGLCLYGALYALIGRLFPEPMIACPQCGLPNITERRVCKRCRGTMEQLPGGASASGT